MTTALPEGNNEHDDLDEIYYIGSEDENGISSDEGHCEETDNESEEDDEVSDGDLFDPIDLVLSSVQDFIIDERANEDKDANMVNKEAKDTEDTNIEGGMPGCSSPTLRGQKRRLDHPPAKKRPVKPSSLPDAAILKRLAALSLPGEHPLTGNRVDLESHSASSQSSNPSSFAHQSSNPARPPALASSINPARPRISSQQSSSASSSASLQAPVTIFRSSTSACPPAPGSASASQPSNSAHPPAPGFAPPRLSRSASSPGQLPSHKSRKTSVSTASVGTTSTTTTSRVKKWVLNVDTALEEEHEDVESSTFSDLDDFDLENKHVASREWCRNYKSCALGSVPSLEDCQHAPRSQQALSMVPIRKSRRQNSVLGHFFSTADKEGVLMDRCEIVGQDGTICGRMYSKKSGGMTRGKHLLSRHADIYHAVNEFRAYQARVQGIALPKDSEFHTNPTKLFQAAREDILQQNLRKPMETDINRFSQLLLQLVVEEGVPFRFLKSKALMRLVNFLNPNFKVPSVDSLQALLDERVQAQKRFIRSYIGKRVDRGSITLDGWTSRDQRKYLGITYHFFSTSTTMSSFVIGMERHTGSQTAEVLKASVEKVLAEWDLGGRILGITTDQGSNVKKAMKDHEDEHQTVWIPCASHKMQLCVNKALDNSVEAKALLNLCRAITALFSKSTIATDCLLEQQKGSGFQVKLISMNKTRWNSWYLLMERILRIAGAIARTQVALSTGTKDQKEKADELQKLALDQQALDAIREILLILKPAADFTHWAGTSRQSTIAEIYPRVHSLLLPEDSLVTDTAKKLHKALKEQINRVWSLSSIPKAILLSIFFHPYFCSRSGIMEDTIEGKSNLHRATTLATEVVATHLNDRQAKTGGVQAIARLRLIAAFNVHCYKLDLQESILNLEVYKDNPQQYWLERQTQHGYEALWGAALPYLCIQATSSESERLFSRAGLVLSAKTCRLGDENFRNLIFARSFFNVVAQIRVFEADEKKRAKQETRP